jgi:predicted transposase/invertase (TIGR01784 family)
MQEAYQNNLKVYRDNRNVEISAYIKGEAKGRAEGTIEIARNLKQEGSNIALIAKTTGLSEAEIEQL